MSTPENDLGFAHRFISGREGGLTLLLLHGTGGNEEDLIPLGREIAPEAGILSPRGKVIENGMPRFFRRFGEGKFDTEDLKFRTRELADFVLAASKRYKFYLKRLVAVGYSNGANIAASMLLLRPDSLSGAILFRAMLPLVPETLPDLSSKRVFLSSGKYDEIIPKENAEQLSELLRKAGAKVEMNWNSANHALMERELKLAGAWLSNLAL
ncbi:MAG: alpha/beta hydrolase [Nitrososphaerales archaeon]